MSPDQKLHTAERNKDNEVSGFVFKFVGFEGVGVADANEVVEDGVWRQFSAVKKGRENAPVLPFLVNEFPVEVEFE